MGVNERKAGQETGPSGGHTSLGPAGPAARAHVSQQPVLHCEGLVSYFMSYNSVSQPFFHVVPPTQGVCLNIIS